MHIRLASVMAICVVAVARAQTPDPQTLGPKVGAHAPDFTLRDQRGVARTLRSTFGPKGAVLVFYRSADW